MQRGMHCRQTWLMRLVITSLCIRDSFLAAFLSPQNASSTQCPCICYQSCSAPVYTGSTLPIVQLMALLSVSWQGLTCLHINVPLAASGCMRHLPLPLTAQPLFPQTCIVGTLQSRVKGQLLLDPTSDESYHEDGTVLMAMMPTANLVSGACAKSLSNGSPALVWSHTRIASSVSGCRHVQPSSFCLSYAAALVSCYVGMLRPSSAACLLK